MTALQAHLDLPYLATSDNPRHKLDLYLPASPAQCKGLIVFVHGGAWRSSSSRHASIARIPSLFPKDYALAIPNYRLCAHGEDVKWPAHTLDVKQAVEWLVGDGAAGGLLKGEEWTQARDKVWFVGHSAGAHIIGHFLLQHPDLPIFSSTLRSTFKGFLFSEPIADIDDLVNEYPDYSKWFIVDAFGPGPYLSTSFANPKSPFFLPPTPSLQSLVVSHSPADTLISRRQPSLLFDRLVGLGLVGKSVLLGKDDLGDHDDLLSTEAFAARVKDWVEGRPGVMR